MAFPTDSLTANEHVLLHIRPHWKALIGPAVVGILAVAVVIAVLAWDGNNVAVYAAVILAVVVALWLAVRPWLTWISSHYVFTNERVMIRSGVLSRNRRDVPLNRISDHSVMQSLADRGFGCGRLTIESAGERGQVILESVPHVDRVQTMLNEIIDLATGDRTPRTAEPAPDPRPAV